ncbi:MAG: hypothetical protein APR53_04795 [Methanoculleus sp. SDB]|nr:MAG: hypothetical protein APR53_04795 [Methanoculleus sp. SDB]
MSEKETAGEHPETESVESAANTPAQEPPEEVSVPEEPAETAPPEEPAPPEPPKEKPAKPPQEAPSPPPAAVVPPQIIRERVVEVREEKKGFGRLKIALILLALLAAIVVVGVLTLNVQISAPDPGDSYPYTTTYDVHFPLAQPVTIGNTKMIALTAEDEMIIQVDQNPGQKIVVGEERKISERKATITVLGIQAMQTNFQIYLKYLGMDGIKARFYLTVKRSDDIPQFLIDRLLPPEIDARPA